MGDRCAGPEPLEAAQAAGAFLAGLEGAGVRGCLKHFPGLGGLALDSHLGLPEPGDPAGQRQRHALPFRMLAHPDRLAMVAHLRLPGTGGLPASLCRALVADNPWGVRARWLPDDLEMGGCAGLGLGGAGAAVPGGRAPGPAGVPDAGRSRRLRPGRGGLPEALWRPALERSWPAPAAAPGAARFRRGRWEAWVQDVRREAGA